MRPTLLPCLSAFALALSISSPSTSAEAAEVLGTKPSHVWGGPSSVVNDQAMTRMIWAPGIDEGYVPQGLSWAPGVIYVAGYQSTDTKVGQGPCRLFKLDAETGQTLGQFDLPDTCGHAGGLVNISPDVLIVADTRHLYRVDLQAAFTPERAASAITASVGLRGELRGAFIDFDGKELFVGSYAKDEAGSKGHFLPLSIFETQAGKTIDATAATRFIALPLESQGAAFDRDGALWVTASNSRMGMLHRLSSQTGEIAASYEMVIGIEDIGFDASGQLWSVSEAGSLRWRKWSKVFPVISRIDVSRLKAK